MRRRVITIALTACLAAALAGCSGAPTETASDMHVDAPGDEGQSTTTACQVVQESITSATDAFTSTGIDDPAGMVEAMSTAATQLGTVATQVTNDEVAALLPPLREAFERTATTMEALAGGDVSKLTEIQEITASFQETAEQFQALCPAS